MKNMSFKKWLKLQEVGTGTNAVAAFSRPIFSQPIERGFKKRGKKKKSGIKLLTLSFNDDI